MIGHEVGAGRAVEAHQRHIQRLDDGGGGGVEDPPCALDVDARHERLVGNRVDDGGQVDEHLGCFQQRLELGAADVDAMEGEVPDAAQRIPNIQADQARHLRFVGQSRQQPLAHEPRRAGDGNRNHVHRLAA